MYYLFYFIFEVKTKTEYMTCLYGSNLNDTRLDIKNQDLKTEDKFKSITTIDRLTIEISNRKYDTELTLDGWRGEKHSSYMR